MVTLEQIAAEGVEHARELPLPPLVLGIGAFLVLCALLAITWQFDRNR
ncbi:MAG: hypothetical protein M3Q27_16335 [Actinomycetota bacterium]|nr:hypothetical protein [Actinomycetota bacterium]